MPDDVLSHTFLLFRQLGYPLSPSTFEAVVHYLLDTDDISIDSIPQDTLLRALVKLFSVSDWSRLPCDSVFLPSRGFSLAKVDQNRCTQCNQLLLVPSDDYAGPRCSCPGLSIAQLLGLHAVPRLHTLPCAARVMGTFVFQVVYAVDISHSSEQQASSAEAYMKQVYPSHLLPLKAPAQAQQHTDINTAVPTTTATMASLAAQLPCPPPLLVSSALTAAEDEGKYQHDAPPPGSAVLKLLLSDGSMYYPALCRVPALVAAIGATHCHVPLHALNHYRQEMGWPPVLPDGTPFADSNGSVAGIGMGEGGGAALSVRSSVGGAGSHLSTGAGAGAGSLLLSSHPAAPLMPTLALYALPALPRVSLRQCTVATRDPVLRRGVLMLDEAAQVVHCTHVAVTAAGVDPAAITPSGPAHGATAPRARARMYGPTTHAHAQASTPSSSSSSTSQSSFPCFLDTVSVTTVQRHVSSLALPPNEGPPTNTVARGIDAITHAIAHTQADASAGPAMASTASTAALPGYTGPVADAHLKPDAALHMHSQVGHSSSAMVLSSTLSSTHGAVSAGNAPTSIVAATAAAAAASAASAPFIHTTTTTAASARSRSRPPRAPALSDRAAAASSSGGDASRGRTTVFDSDSDNDSDSSSSSSDAGPVPRRLSALLPTRTPVPIASTPASGPPSGATLAAAHAYTAHQPLASPLTATHARTASPGHQSLLPPLSPPPLEAPPTPPRHPRAPPSPHTVPHTVPQSLAHNVPAQGGSARVGGLPQPVDAGIPMRDQSPSGNVPHGTTCAGDVPIHIITALATPSASAVAAAAATAASITASSPQPLYRRRSVPLVQLVKSPTVPNTAPHTALHAYNAPTISTSTSTSTAAFAPTTTSSSASSQQPTAAKSEPHVVLPHASNTAASTDTKVASAAAASASTSMSASTPRATSAVPVVALDEDEDDDLVVASVLLPPRPTRAAVPAGIYLFPTNTAPCDVYPSAAALPALLPAQLAVVRFCAVYQQLAASVDTLPLIDAVSGTPPAAAGSMSLRVIPHIAATATIAPCLTPFFTAALIRTDIHTFTPRAADVTAAASVCEVNASDVRALQEQRLLADTHSMQAGGAGATGVWTCTDTAQCGTIVQALMQLWDSGKPVPENPRYGPYSGFSLPFTNAIPPIPPKYLLPESVYPEKSFPLFPKGPYVSFPHARVAKLVARLPSAREWRHVFLMTCGEFAMFFVTSDALLSRLIYPRALYVHTDPAHSSRAAVATELFKTLQGTLVVRLPTWVHVARGFLALKERGVTEMATVPLVSPRSYVKYMKQIPAQALLAAMTTLFNCGALPELVGFVDGAT